MSEATPLSVVIADDHPLFRMGLRYALLSQHFQVLAEAEDGEAALERCLQHRPDMALLDVKMPILTGIEVCARLHAEYPQTGVVLISTFQEPAILLAAREAGARAYLNKDTSPHDLARTLRAIHADPSRDWLPLPQLPRLTPRERDVLRGVARGLSNKEVARELGLSPDTVKDHVASLFGKLEVGDRVALLNRSRELGLT